MPFPANEDEKRGYREGVVAQRLETHDKHFERLNGEMHRTADALVALDKTVGQLVDQVTGLSLVMPKLTSVADDVLKAETVAETLRQKQLAERSEWERWRNIVAWAGGTLAALAAFATFGMRLLGIGD